jgi:uncharacterized repeat protein (TIGR03803 family)
MSRISIKTVAIAASKQVCLSTMVVLLLAVASTPWAQAQTYEVLHQFHGKDGNGKNGSTPLAGVVRDAAGNLYGTTEQGGDINCVLPLKAVGCGVVFKLSPTGKETVLHTFTGGADGAGPNAGLIRDAAGNLYGTTIVGGNSNSGTVFKVDTRGKETVLYAFTDEADGAIPMAGVIRDTAGNLYGTTSNGFGVVFKLDTTGKETVLHAFTGGADGNYPVGDLIRDAAGNLYGTTEGGGDPNCNLDNPPPGCGVVFKLNPDTRELTVLYAFTDGADGGFPEAGVIRDAAGNLYGTTVSGGDLNCPPFDCGVVFKLDTTGKEKVLHTFTGKADGGGPYAGVIRDAAGNLYGTAIYGGDPNCGCGVVFKLTP